MPLPPGVGWPSLSVPGNGDLPVQDQALEAGGWPESKLLLLPKTPEDPIYLLYIQSHSDSQVFK